MEALGPALQQLRLAHCTLYNLPISWTPIPGSEVSMLCRGCLLLTFVAKEVLNLLAPCFPALKQLQLCGTQCALRSVYSCPLTVLSLDMIDDRACCRFERPQGGFQATVNLVSEDPLPPLRLLCGVCGACLCERVSSYTRSLATQPHIECEVPTLNVWRSLVCGWMTLRCCADNVRCGGECAEHSYV